MANSSIIISFNVINQSILNTILHITLHLSAPQTKILYNTKINRKVTLHDCILRLID